MDPLRSRSEHEFKEQTAALVKSWEENLAQAAPNRQRVFSDYQQLSEACSYLGRWLRSPLRSDAELAELRALAERVAACLAFSTIEQTQAAALKKQLFAGRSRGCRGGPSQLESELLENLEARARQD